MSANDPKLYVRNLTHGPGNYARQRRKFVANKERNWLTALTLNAFAKLASNHALNDLDKIIVDSFTHHGFKPALLKGFGQAYLAMTPQDRQVFFPGNFATLNIQSNYTLQQLKSDLPKLEQATLGMRNASNIDVHGVHTGVARLRQFSVSRETLREFGSGMIRASVPNTTPPNPNYSIKAVAFRCLEESSEWSASDEVYWLFGTIAKGVNITARSHVFEDVDNGEVFSFASDEGVMWGPNGVPQDFPDGEVGGLISLWENDEGDPSETQAGFAAGFGLATAILVASGYGAGVAAVVAALGGLVQFFLGFLADDHIADQGFVFTRQAIVDHLGPKPHKTGVTQSFDVTRLFTDGDANYRLRARVTRMT